VIASRPSASTTAPVLGVPTASGAGSSTAFPFLSRKTPGATYGVPSTPRTKTHGEKTLSAGGTSQRPALQAQRPRFNVHSPSSHTAPRTEGCGGTYSALAGGGGASTATRLLSGWGV